MLQDTCEIGRLPAHTREAERLAAHEGAVASLVRSCAVIRQVELPMKKILLTGASGKIGRSLRLALRDHYRLTLFNRSAISDLGPTETLHRGDTTDADAVARAAEGANAIVDMAGVSDVASFRTRLLPVNILGTYNIFEAARLAGVPRVVYASTHHVIGYHPAGERLDERAELRPDSMYAVTKCFAEAMGRLYAEKAALEVVCLRIGYFNDRPLDERHLAVWISPGDMARLVRAALEAASVHFEVVYGVSRNTRNWWDLDRARRILGYEPQDDAEAFASEILRVPADGWHERVRCQGGAKIDAPFMP
jgi:uronate dehydrogenase